MKRLSICLSAVILLPASANAEVINLGTGTTIVTEISREGRTTGSYYSRGRVQTQDVVQKKTKPVFVGSVTIEPVKKAVKKAVIKHKKSALAKPAVTANRPSKPAQNKMPKLASVDDMPMQATNSDMRQPAPAMPVPVANAPRGSHQGDNLPSVPASAQDMERHMRR